MRANTAGATHSILDGNRDDADDDDDDDDDD
jgi:hypothetical protein